MEQIIRFPSLRHFLKVFQDFLCVKRENTLFSGGVELSLLLDSVVGFIPLHQLLDFHNFLA